MVAVNSPLTACIKLAKIKGMYGHFGCLKNVLKSKEIHHQYILGEFNRLTRVHGGDLSCCCCSCGVSEAFSDECYTLFISYV